MIRKSWVAVAAVLAAAAPTVAMPAAAQGIEFKSMTIVVGFTAGGGYDTYARLLARHIGRNTPGQPSVVVQNMPGSSSLKAVQYLDANAPRDGSVMTAFNPGLITESLLDPEKIKFKFTDVAFVGSITRDLRACYAWAANGIKSWDDLIKAPEFNIGAPAAGTSTYINAAVLKNMFGVKLRQVTGYPGSAEERLAIERGELDGGCGAWSSNPPDWVNNRRINPIVAFSEGDIPKMIGKPPFIVDLATNQQDKDVLNVLIAPDAVGRPYVASRQVAAERLAVTRKSFDATVRDSQFLAEAEKLDLPVVGPISGADAEEIIARIYGSPPSLVERAKVVAR
ncbi:MAG: Bug family tripartite tricarboxylate transporter substrate binding protein [Gemmatimonas sp.]